MRFIIPNYALPDSFVDNVKFTLQAMGHEVLSPPPPVRYFNHKVVHIIGDFYNKAYPNSLTPQEKWILKIKKEYKPDVLLALTQSIQEELLADLRSSGICTISWWGDTAANMRNQGLLCEGWDHIFIKDKYAAFKLNTLGLRAQYLPEAMNPAWHKWNFNEQEINGSILFAGNTYDYRHFLIRKLMGNGFNDIHLFGHRPPRWARPEVRRLFLDKYIIKEEKSLEFGRSMVCINSTAMSEGNSLNCRAFEIAGAGGLQLLEYRPAVEDCFEPGKELLTYSSLEELTHHLEYVRTDREGAMRIRKAGYKRALAEHTYEHRLKNILRSIDEDR